MAYGVGGVFGLNCDLWDWGDGHDSGVVVMGRGGLPLSRE